MIRPHVDIAQEGVPGYPDLHGGGLGVIGLHVVVQVIVVGSPAQFDVRAFWHDDVDVAAQGVRLYVQPARQAFDPAEVDRDVAQNGQSDEFALDIPRLGPRALVEPPSLEEWLKAEEPAS
jgi:hypothetical protein